MIRLLGAAVLAAFFCNACSHENPVETVPIDSHLISTQSFSINLPNTFEITSFSGESSRLPAHLTVVEGQNLITISKAAYFRDINESCKLAANNFVHDMSEITSGPRVLGGICRISAKTRGIKSVLFMIRDNDNGILYSITYKGALSRLREIVKTLRGDRFLDILKYQYW